MKKFKAVDGGGITEREYQQLRALQEGASAKEDVLKKLKEKSLKEMSGSISEAEIDRVKKLMPKKAKGGEIVIGKGSDYIKDLL